MVGRAEDQEKHWVECIPGRQLNMDAWDFDGYPNSDVSQHCESAEAGATSARIVCDADGIRAPDVATSPAWLLLSVDVRRDAVSPW